MARERREKPEEQHTHRRVCPHSPLGGLSRTAALVRAFDLAAATQGNQGAGPSVEQDDQYQVKLDNVSFLPAALTVPAGTKVTWTHHDDVPHSVVSTDRKFASPVLDTDEQFSYEFKDPGTYAYYCSIHPKMTGKVIVQ